MNLRRAARALTSPAGQKSFFASTRGVISPAGQRTATEDFREVTARVPTLLIWNVGDPVIPVAHARAAEGRLAPGEQARRLPRTQSRAAPGEAQRFADEVAKFIGSS